MEETQTGHSYWVTGERGVTQLVIRHVTHRTAASYSQGPTTSCEMIYREQDMGHAVWRSCMIKSTNVGSVA